MLKVVQCWDDGVVSDIRLIEILRKYNAKASFNLNASKHQEQRQGGWMYQDKYPVQRLAQPELTSVYEGFTIANHSLTHPHLEKLAEEDVRKEVHENRKILQDWFQQPIDGFVYPFGTYNDIAMRVIREEGHCYARTTENALPTVPVAEPMAFAATCHFRNEQFMDLYERSKNEGGVFYFWGHSYEIVNDEMWQAFESKIKHIEDDAESEWCELVDLF